MASQKISVYFLWSIKFILTNYMQLLLYISYEQSDLYMLVAIKALLVYSNYKCSGEHIVWYGFNFFETQINMTYCLPNTLNHSFPESANHGNKKVWKFLVSQQETSKWFCNLLSIVTIQKSRLF